MLGATPRGVIGKVMREALVTVLAGVTLGVIGALYLSRFLTSLLFGIAPGDAATLASVIALSFFGYRDTSNE